MEAGKETGMTVYLAPEGRDITGPKTRVYMQIHRRECSLGENLSEDLGSGFCTLFPLMASLLPLPE